MASDYISRSEFDRTMQERYCFNCERKGNYPIFGVACKACWVLDMLDEVEQFQSADVRPVVRGKWISDGAGYHWTYNCSICGWKDEYPFNERHNYCPNCGAKMDGGVNDATD